ncbi:MAG: AAA family ATPase [Nanoarchaeota archaeon]|jgi:septum site-determining protein MinD|nr:AAA family ATPase [Nanoarchaeota archaeon]
MSDSKIFGIIALKGGVGKTTIASNIGTSLSKDFQKKVLIIDANFSTPHLGLHLGIVNPKYTLHHVLNDNHSIFEAIYQHELGFHVIPGKLSPFKIDPTILRERLEPLRNIYDVIIIDSSPSLNEEMYATMAASDELLVVSSPDYPTLSSTIHAISVAGQKGANIRGIVINRAYKKKFELSKKDIESASGTKILAIIPHDVKVLSALSKMTPVVAHSPKQDVSVKIKDLAGSLVGVKKKRRASFFGKKKDKDQDIVDEA